MKNKEWNKFIKEELELEDDVILVKNQEDVIKVDNILSKIGIQVLSDENRKEWETETKDVDNNFLIKEDDGWRIQSHYLGFGTPVEKLEEKINIILTNSEAISKILKLKKDKIRDLEKEIIIIKESMKKVLDNIKK